MSEQRKQEHGDVAWPRDPEWECPNEGAGDCPSRRWHDTHLHFRTFANVTTAADYTLAFREQMGRALDEAAQLRVAYDAMRENFEREERATAKLRALVTAQAETIASLRSQLQSVMLADDEA